MSGDTHEGIMMGTLSKAQNALGPTCCTEWYALPHCATSVTIVQSLFFCQLSISEHRFCEAAQALHDQQGEECFLKWPIDVNIF